MRGTRSDGWGAAGPKTSVVDLDVEEGTLGVEFNAPVGRLELDVADVGVGPEGPGGEAACPPPGVGWIVCMMVETCVIVRAPDQFWV